jgi:hypothetical protein
MSDNNPIDTWRDITGIGHGASWCAPTSYNADARVWGAAIKHVNKDSTSASPSSEKSTLSSVSVSVSGKKGLNAEAPVFVPGGGVAEGKTTP